MTRHLEPVPDPFEELLGPATDRDGGGHDDGGWHDDSEPLARPTWWRWVAIVVVVAMIVATPAAYALYLLLR